MDVYFFQQDQFSLHYNCSFYDIDVIPIQKRQHFAIGVSFIILFVIFEMMYIPSLLVMRTKQFYHQSCYKLMYFMGQMDIICLFISGFFTGYFSIIGYVYCNSPTLIYFLGLAANSLWVVQADTGMMLAFNRCLEMYNPDINAKLFKGKRSYFWITISIAHSAYLFLFTKPVAFSALYCSWFFNPHVGYFEDYMTTYSNTVHTIHNFTVVIVLTSCYLVFVILLFRKSHILYGQTSFQKESYIQVFIICLINGTAAATYSYMQFFPVSDILILIAQYAWFFAHGAPAVIYLSINKSIQRRIFKSSTVAVNTSKMQTISTVKFTNTTRAVKINKINS